MRPLLTGRSLLFGVAAASYDFSREVAVACSTLDAIRAPSGARSQREAVRRHCFAKSSMKPTRTDITAHDLQSTEREPSEDQIQMVFPDYPNQRQITKFYSTLGEAVSTWQLVEASLYRVYEKAADPQMRGAAACGFHALQAFNIKLMSTNAAVKFAIVSKAEVLGGNLNEDAKKLMSEWEVLQERANTKAQQRNAFVHFSTLVMFTEKREER